MPVPRLVASHDVVVGLDYSQFYLHAGYTEPDLVVEVGGLALSEGGIAQRGALLVVTSPHQNNFQMSLRVELWDGQPEDDLGDWQEAFEAHLVIGADGLVYESPTLECVVLPIARGSYHTLITGRGFVARGWPGSTTPGDEWRLRLWPSDGPAQARRIQLGSQRDTAV